MAQLPPPLVKHPALPPNPFSGNAPISTDPQAAFVPRKEFIKDRRVVSSFSLLTLSGSGFVRLYSFSAVVISALRRLFDQKNLVITVHQDEPKHFYEFALEGKPWTRPQSITSEKLIVDILYVILHFSYTFLSTIDYGREQDDKLVLVFSKPTQTASPNSSTMQHPSSSAASLTPPARTPFAISFVSATILRVIGAPLSVTPAVLGAMRGTWPRGVLSDKKVGDLTYEFKLKGYKCTSHYVPRTTFVETRAQGSRRILLLQTRCITSLDYWRPLMPSASHYSRP